MAMCNNKLHCRAWAASLDRLYGEKQGAFEADVGSARQDNVFATNDPLCSDIARGLMVVTKLQGSLFALLSFFMLYSVTS